MFAVFFLGAASSAAAACSAIPGYFSGSIPGVKNFTGELYKATWTGPGAASVFSVGSPSGWSTSSLAFSADNTTVVATFDNHHVGHGTVGASCAVISWDDKSVWQTAPPPQKLNIHLSPHSHDDVGWDATYMEYFLGCHPPGVRYANVSQEISGVVQGLLADARRRFSVVEQAYFQIWFEAQAPALQAQVQTLVAQRRLVFLNGGWSMHDESNPTYIDMLDNTAVGHRNIVNNFGVAGLPKVTWQIDPFGHSAFQGVLSSSLGGYAGIYWGREDQSYKDIMSKEKGLERVWLPSPSLGASAAAWQGIFIDNSYATTHALERCDTEFSPSPSSCNRNFATGDVDNVFGNLLGRPATIRGNDLLIMLGDDFAWPIAGIYFDYVDGLVDALNNHPSGLFNASYATPESYMLAKLASVPSFPSTVGDFFPYADDDAGHNLWTGYFVSRPAFKGLVRDSSAYLQGARQLQLMAGGVADAGPANPLFKLERAMGVAQHHDAISGTAMQRVDQDYIRILAEARADAFSSIAASLAAVSGCAGWSLCELHNVTHCPALEAGKPTVVFVYNALGQADGAAPLRLAVGLPAGVASYSVANALGAPVTAQLLPLSERDEELRALYNNNAPAPPGLAVQWLCFQGALPAAGFAAFFLTPTASAAGAPRTFFSARVAAAATAGNNSITNGRVTLTFDPATAMVSGFSDSVTGAAAPLTQRWLVYTGADGSDLNGSRQASGAYIFRPLVQTPLPVPTEGAPPALTLFTGPVVSEARSVVGYVSQSTRLWAGAADVECEWTVGPVDRQPAGAPAPLSQEVVTRYDGGWGSGTGPSAWVSDSNCREGQARRTAWRPQPQWNYSGSEPVSENYFPTGCLVRTSSPNLTLAVAVDRAQGSTSPSPGVLEVMVHRRMAHDDGRGVGEALNEPGLDGKGLIIRGRHWLVVAPVAAAAPLYKVTQQRALALPNNIVGFAPLGALTPSAWLAMYKGGASVLAAPLPPNVHLATLHALAPTRVLLRLAHTYDAGEHPDLAQNATVGLAGLLQGWAITEAVDYTLPGSQPLAGVPQSVLTTDDGTRYVLPVLPDAPTGAQLLVTLPPMSIRTLMCTVEKR